MRSNNLYNPVYSPEELEKADGGNALFFGLLGRLFRYIACGFIVHVLGLLFLAEEERAALI